MRAVCTWIAMLVVLLFSPAANAAIERYAVIVGNNEGERDEATLRYAHDDARKVYEVLRDLGDFRPENVVLLQGESAAAFDQVLVAMNDRIRSQADEAQTLLFVYFSGHADAQALHLGDDRLQTRRLRQLVRGSAADMRILMVDACRSGALTRVKGGAQAPPFEIGIDDRLSSEGLVFLTSASANEDAQESDLLKGSFFTHYFVSGLIGAADRNGDGSITLEEAYAHAYEHTLRASSRTLFGTQHPTFSYDLRGRGGVILTRVRSAHRNRGLLSLPSDRNYLVFARDEEGPVVAEVGPRDRTRTISLPAGRYFIRGRARDHMLEGRVEVAAHESVAVANEDLRRIEYARLARKGGDGRQLAHGPLVGYQLRTPLWRGAAPCHGARIGYAVEHRFLSVTPRLGFCRSGFDNATVRATLDELDVDVIFSHVFDVPYVGIGIGLGGGVSWMRQSFETRGAAPTRNTIAGHVDAALTLLWELPRGFYIETSVNGQLYLLEQQKGSDSGKVGFEALLSARPFVGVGKRF